MRHFTFSICRKEPAGRDERLFVGEALRFEFSTRLGVVLDQLRRAYGESFPGAPPMRFGVLTEPRNGASSRWAQAESDLIGPTHVVEIDPNLLRDEAIFAHELVHPAITLRGIPTGKSLGEIPESIGDEFTSTCHHPFVFDVLDDAGYGDEQRAGYKARAETELAKLSTSDLTSGHYTQPPGQTWSALWYFNFYLLARAEYDAIYAVHRRSAPGVAERMDQVVAGWMAATRRKGSLKRSAAVQQTRAFQSELHRRLDLTGRVAFQPREHWERFLFP